MKSSQDSGGVSVTRHILLFLCLLFSAEHQPPTDCDFLPLLGHPFLFEQWVIPTTSCIGDASEVTFIDRKYFKSLPASHLETKVCILFKCKMEFQDISPLLHPGLQGLYRTALNSHIKKKILKQRKSFPRLNTVLCKFEKKKRLFWGCVICCILEEKEKIFLLCATRF